MKILIISDTHIPKKRKHLPTILDQECQSCDLLIHAGDWQTVDVYSHFSKKVRTEGVTGNVDDPELKQHLNEKLILDICGFKIGVIHGHGNGKTTERRALDAFSNDKVDCIIFGHSHIPLLKKHEEILLFNPGSPTDKRRQPRYSYGIMNVESELSARHIFF